MYPPFRPLVLCAKCGDLGPARVLWQQGIVEPFKEYLLRTCRICGYFWKERCEDKDDNYYEREEQ